MEVQKAIEIKKALILISDLTGIDPVDIVARICLYDKEKQSVFVEASKIWNKFDDADLSERARMLGIEFSNSTNIKNVHSRTS